MTHLFTIAQIKSSSFDSPPEKKAAGVFLHFTAPVGKDGVDVVYLRLCISLTPSQARKLPKVKLECGRRDGRREGGI